jgi:hypothetical protein
MLCVVQQLVEGRLFTSSYDGCLKVWDVSELGNGHDPNFKLRYAPRVGPMDDGGGGDQKNKEQAKEIERFSGGQLDNNNQEKDGDKIMIE